MIMPMLLLLAAQSQMQADVAAEADFRRADAAMNVQYRETIAAMRRMDRDAPAGIVGPSYQNALLASQRAWLQFRDAECVVEGFEYRGGTAEPMRGSQCQAALTDARTRQLRAIAAWSR